jgi:hypothetical protein
MNSWIRGEIMSKHTPGLAPDAALRQYFDLADACREVDRLRAVNAEMLAALRQLVASCDTGHRNTNGSQMGVRTPDKPAVEFARAAIAKATS